MLHCNNSTTLEEFSDAILVESNLSERADIEGIGTNMDSDQVGLRTFDCSFLLSCLLETSFAPFGFFKEVQWSPFSSYSAKDSFF